MDQSFIKAISIFRGTTSKFPYQLNICCSLDKWIREAKPTNSRKHQLTSEQQRILELEKEVKQLRQVNDILKKVHVYFLTDHAKTVHGNSRSGCE